MDSTAWSGIHRGNSLPDDVLSHGSDADSSLHSASLSGVGADESTLADIDRLIESWQNSSSISFGRPQDAIRPFEPGTRGLSSPLLDFQDIPNDQTPGRKLASGDQDYLQSQGCYQLPSPPALRVIMECYFKFIHPHLPLLCEHEFWTLWKDDQFQVGGYSLLLVQAMIYASIGLVEEHVIHGLGIRDKREAQTIFYRKAKLLGDFGVERDPVFNAQACLLLSHRTCTENSARLDSYWLLNAIRFSRIARADVFERFQGREKSKLKRLWWCVLFRDRMLSLGLRKALQIQQVPPESNILTEADFEFELGRSMVHDRPTQEKLVALLSVACKFFINVTPALRLLYSTEDIEHRLNMTSRSLPQTAQDIRKSIDTLDLWHYHYQRQHPLPIGQDNSHDTICVFGNMLYIYHDAVKVALHSYVVIIYVLFGYQHVPFKTSRRLIKDSMNNTMDRMGTLLLGRPVAYLPTCALPCFLLPITLQTINVSASQSSDQGPIHAQKLNVFIKILQSQRNAFDEAAYCLALAHSLIAQVYGSEDALTTLAGHEGVSGLFNGHGQSQSAQRKPTWEEILDGAPRVYLRINMFLDSSLCKGITSQDRIFLPDGSTL